MCSDISGVSSAARDYYRMKYATEDEKEEIRNKKKWNFYSVLVSYLCHLSV